MIVIPHHLSLHLHCLQGYCQVFQTACQQYPEYLFRIYDTV
jgi:hypothetical protein